ncbi:hypothetical protein MES4922_220039 [Mesorhizobium ventifaucium]|uniref:Uncharacterized protein n=1 Tax=Mesorhizobium ventifaucium TaxID=666020 RepID=A0ABM9DSS5_9HYPH|nr:hypothetical protein MES4922_220039 [Mesorhizobium ventifaucium]
MLCKPSADICSRNQPAGADESDFINSDMGSQITGIGSQWFRARPRQACNIQPEGGSRLEKFD